MRVLVTGGAGFIGSHVVERLLRAGHAVVALDNLSSGRRENLPSDCPLLVLDLRDAALAETVERLAPRALLHFAAQIDLRRSLEDPLGDAEENIVGSLRLLEAAVAAGAEHFVFASSGGAIYGEALAPQDEAHREAPLSPYGVAKLAVDKYLDVYARQGRLATCSLRLSNVYGPRQADLGEAGVVAVFARRLAAGQPLRVHGDGGQTRDFLFVDDVAALAERVIAGRATGVFNAGTGVETSIARLAERMSALAGGGGIEAAPPVAGEQRRSVLDPGKAASELGWRASTALDDGLARTIDWFAKPRVAR